MKTYFDHEKLNAYQLSLGFNEWVGELLATLSAKAAAKDQLRFFDISRGSALETAAALDVLVSRKVTTVEVVTPAKEQLVQIVKGLLKTLGCAFETFGNRVGETDAYFSEQEREKE
jgi:hypothetical protein